MANVSENSLFGLATNILNIVGGGRTTDDNRYSERQIMYWIRSYYSRILTDEQLQRRYQPINPDLIQSYCIKLTKASSNECGCGDGCVVWKGEIPRFISWYGQPAILYVGGLDGSMQYQLAQPNAISGLRLGRFGNNQTYYYIQGSTIFVFPPPTSLSCEVLVKGVPDDVTETTSGVCFDYWSTDVRIPLRYIPKITQLVLRNEMGFMSQTPPDLTNNDNPT